MRSVPARIIGLLAGVIAATLLVVEVTARADRAVAWVTVDGAFERELNTHAARGLRLAATSDGLPCTVAVMQAPERAGAPAAYRVVQERELAAALDGLIDEGFMPRASARTIGTRHQVVFERTTPTRPPGDWRLIAFDKLEDLEAALVAAAGEGFQVRLIVRARSAAGRGCPRRGWCWR